MALLAAYLVGALVELVATVALLVLMAAIVGLAVAVLWAANRWLGTPWLYVVAAPVTLLAAWPLARVFVRVQRYT